MSTLHPLTDDEPVVYLIGYGFRPAYQPADYVGPRLDCAMWLPTDDSDAAYAAKWDGPANPTVTTDAPGYAWETWIPSAQPSADRITAAELSGPVANPAVWHPSTPSQPWWPSEPNEPWFPCCIIREPETPMPPIAPVPVSASAGSMLAVAIIGSALCGWMARRRA